MKVYWSVISCVLSFLHNALCSPVFWHPARKCSFLLFGYGWVGFLFIPFLPLHGSITWLERQADIEEQCINNWTVTAYFWMYVLSLPPSQSFYIWTPSDIVFQSFKDSFLSICQHSYNQKGGAPNVYWPFRVPYWSTTPTGWSEVMTL